MMYDHHNSFLHFSVLMLFLPFGNFAEDYRRCMRPSVHLSVNLYLSAREIVKESR